MARDFVEILKRVEALYPAAIGGTQHDDNLRSMLVPWANDVLRELSQMQRWSYEYQLSSFVIDSTSATYTLPATYSAIKRVFLINSTGLPVQLDKRERFEAARIFGDDSYIGTANPVPGTPRMWALDGDNQIEFFPTPDNAGLEPFGKYKVFIEGYIHTPQIVEVSGSTTAASTTLTIPSTDYLLRNGLLTGAGTWLSVRGAGRPQFSTGNDTLVTGWTSISATDTTTVTMADQAIANTTNAQTFFNSAPWVIVYWPKVMLFALLREVAAYTGSPTMYQLWEQRYQAELQLLRAHEFDKSRTIELKASAHVGQETAEERRLDVPVGLDVRGIL